jgi:hypothetical protein
LPASGSTICCKQQVDLPCITEEPVMNISRLAFVALLGATIGVAANAQQSATPTQKATNAASQDCMQMPNKKHEHGADRGAGKMAMQPCAPAAGASAPARKLRKTHDSRKPA